jgi:hypothetical protein
MRRHCGCRACTGRSHQVRIEAEFDKTIRKADSFKERISSHAQPAILTKLDELIEQARRMHADLTTLKRQLQQGSGETPTA